MRNDDKISINILNFINFIPGTGLEYRFSIQWYTESGSRSFKRILLSPRVSFHTAPVFSLWETKNATGRIPHPTTTDASLSPYSFNR